MYKIRSRNIAISPSLESCYCPLTSNGGGRTGAYGLALELLEPLICLANDIIIFLVIFLVHGIIVRRHANLALLFLFLSATVSVEPSLRIPFDDFMICFGRVSLNPPSLSMNDNKFAVISAFSRRNRLSFRPSSCPFVRSPTYAVLTPLISLSMNRFGITSTTSAPRPPQGLPPRQHHPALYLPS